MQFKPPSDAITDSIKKTADGMADQGTTFLTTAKGGLDSFGSVPQKSLGPVPGAAPRLEPFNDRRYDERVINPATTTTGQPTLKNNEPETAQDVLANLLDWNENVLSGLQQATYKIRFYMVEDKPLMYGNYSSYHEFVQRSIHSRKQTTIATTGVSDINITRLTIQTVSAPNSATRSMAATNITLELKEPMGISLMDMMARAAEELGVRNFSKAFYMLEVSFHGYDEEGNFVVNPCSHFKNNGLWLYQVAIKNIDTEMNDAGGKYTLTMIPYEEKMYDESDLRFPDTLVIEGTTVKEMLERMAEQLNSSITDMYGYLTRAYKFKFYKFKHKDVEYNPETFSVKISQEELASKRALTMTEVNGPNGKVKAHFNKGLAINDAVELVFANCEEAQKLGITTTEDYQKDKDTKKMRDCLIFRVEVTSDIMVDKSIAGATDDSYDWLNQNYIMEYTLHVLPYYTQVPILHYNDVVVSNDPKTQAQNAQKLRKEGYLAKRYDYLFTGLNTEVLRYDIKYNLSWQAALPKILGFGTSIESSSTNDKYDPEIENKARETQQVLIQLNREYKALLEEVKELDKEIDRYKNSTEEQKAKMGGAESVDKKLQEAEAKKAELMPKVQSHKEGVTNLGKMANEQARALNEAKNASVNKRLPQLSSHRFAEEVLEEYKAGTRYKVPISFQQSTADTRFMASGAIQDGYSNTRSVFGTVMDQLYGPMSTGLQKATLEIRGDPYWLGYGNMERSYALNTFKNATEVRKLESPSVDLSRPDYAKGDIMYMVTFRYPKGFDDGGAPIIGTDDFFTGVYFAKQITHTFEHGIFKQTIEGGRMPLIDVFKAFGYKDDENQAGPAQPTQQQREALAEMQRETKGAMPPPKKESTTTDPTITAKEPNTEPEPKAEEKQPEAAKTAPPVDVKEEIKVEEKPPTEEQKATEEPKTEPLVQKGSEMTPISKTDPYSGEPEPKLTDEKLADAIYEEKQLSVQLSNKKHELRETKSEFEKNANPTPAEKAAYDAKMEKLSVERVDIQTRRNYLQAQIKRADQD